MSPEADTLFTRIPVPVCLCNYTYMFMHVHVHVVHIYNRDIL